MMIYVLKILAFVGLAVAGAWVYNEPKFDSWVALISAIVVLAGLFVASGRPPKKPNQSQVVGKGATAIQAGNDVNFTQGSQGKKSADDAE